MVNSSCGVIAQCMVSGLSRSALKASISRATSAELLLPPESESVNTPAHSRLDRLIQAHNRRVGSDRSILETGTPFPTEPPPPVILLS